MIGIPLGVPLVWSNSGKNDLQEPDSLLEIGRDSTRHPEIFR